MMVDGIPPLLRGIFDDIVSSRGIPKRGKGVKDMGIFVGTNLSICLSEIRPKMRLGPRGKVDGICGFVWGCYTHKDD
jgi:hypothetical protein